MTGRGRAMSVARSRLAEPALAVAPQLLGAMLLSEVDGRRVIVRITEVEAYEGDHGPGLARLPRPTKRNAVMFGPAGQLYCYFVYGMHWCANVTCATAGNRRGRAAAGGRDRRGRTVRPGADAEPRCAPAKLASGPARLARSLG